MWLFCRHNVSCHVANDCIVIVDAKCLKVRWKIKLKTFFRSFESVTYEVRDAALIEPRMECAAASLSQGQIVCLPLSCQGHIVYRPI